MRSRQLSKKSRVPLMQINVVLGDGHTQAIVHLPFHVKGERPVRLDNP